VYSYDVETKVPVVAMDGEIVATTKKKAGQSC
jgi:hypothetical protein